ncbi:Aldedh-domain-containing protein [Athelia psychrophila]|uniref:Aldedh-domain-containing protein n=1 Tax=Athelia psychrophila TaxID=1759441 RepID=A0A167V2K5_9AGAM|nr:Aldedh-domain-containing protein [Fibularhizoctonia sp. CBS 109695]KZP20139.1 Aldedh-domain-containing protein [Fibularhizoctonia sp. CBS 109695]
MAPSYPDQRLYYNGKVQSATSNQTFHSIDPTTSQPLATIHTSSHCDIDAAISSARTAFPSWSTTSPVERSRILLRAASLLRERNDDLARTETHDTGKPFTETSAVDVATGADVLEYFAHLVASGGLNGETTQLRPNAWIYTKKEALGVCAGIGAWNYPIQIALWKSAPCLAAGNCMVYKPSEVTPLHGIKLAEIYREAGVPKGVFNVVHGAGDVGAYLTGHEGIAKVSFTGQVSTGQKVAASAAGGMKYMTVELGGKSPCIILPSADLDKAVDGAMMANFYSTGQVCTNGTRVFVHSSMKKAFEKRLVEKMQFIRPGPSFDEATNFGPLVSKVHLDKVRGYIRHGIESDKATLLYGGLDRPSPLPQGTENGFWVRPTVFTDCTDSMLITTDEIFGPVLTILSYEDTEEVIRRANATEMGLAAGVFGEPGEAIKVVDRIEAGITWVNTWGESPAEMSVGGWKMSGVGVENGRKGLDAWVRTRSTLVEGSADGGGTVFARPPSNYVEESEGEVRELSTASFGLHFAVILTRTPRGHSWSNRSCAEFSGSVVRRHPLAEAIHSQHPESLRGQLAFYGDDTSSNQNKLKHNIRNLNDRVVVIKRRHMR